MTLLKRVNAKGTRRFISSDKVELGKLKTLLYPVLNPYNTTESAITEKEIITAAFSSRFFLLRSICFLIGDIFSLASCKTSLLVSSAKLQPPLKRLFQNTLPHSFCLL